MAKNFSDEFKRDVVALYRDTGGATITQIAADLGVAAVTLSAWCKAAGVPIRHRLSPLVDQHPPGVGPLTPCPLHGVKARGSLH